MVKTEVGVVQEVNFQMGSRVFSVAVVAGVLLGK